MSKPTPKAEVSVSPEFDAPTPWDWYEVRPGGDVEIMDAHGVRVMLLSSWRGKHAARIVTAVNAHDPLVEAAKETIRLLDDHVDNALDATIILRAAIALAESTEQDNGDPSEPGHPDNPRSNYDEVRDRL